MRKPFAATLSLLFAFSVPVSAAGPQARTPIEAKLDTNRRLMAQYSWEMGRLRRAQRDVFTRSVSDRLNGLRYKTRALKEDRERLKNRLPISEQADIFLENFVRQHGKFERPKVPEKARPIDETMRLHEEALRFVSDRNFPEAAKRYESIVIDNPNDDEAYLLMGHVYLMMGEYSRAEFAYFNAVHIDRENYDEIVPFYQNMIVQSPNDDVAHSFLGYAYLILGDVERSKDAFEEALRINPANEEAAKGLSLMARRFGGQSE